MSAEQDWDDVTDMDLSVQHLEPLPAELADLRTKATEVVVELRAREIDNEWKLDAGGYRYTPCLRRSRRARRQEAGGQVTPAEAQAEVRRIERELNDAYVGKKATIVSDYNGQNYGTSRPSKRGKVVEIWLDKVNADGVSFFVVGERLGLRFDELDFTKDGAL